MDSFSSSSKPKKLVTSSRRLNVVSPSKSSSSSTESTKLDSHNRTASAANMVQSLATKSTIAVQASLDRSESSREKRQEERRRLQKRAGVSADIADVGNRSGAQDSTKSDGKNALPESSDSPANLAAYQYGLRAIYLLSEKSADRRISKLRRAVGLTNKHEAQIRARVQCTHSSQFFKDFLRKRLKNIDSHPVYRRNSFQDQDAYESWKRAEKERLEAGKIRLKKISSSETVSRERISSDVVARLWIRILQGRELRAKSALGKLANLSGKSSHEPYVVIKLGKQRFQTSLSTDPSSPFWNEEFFIDVPLHLDSVAPDDEEGDAAGDELRLSVWNQINNFPDSKIGQLVFKLSDIQKKFVDDWYPLEKPDRRLKRRSRRLSSGSSRSRSESIKSDSSDSSPSDSSRGELKVSIAYVALQGTGAVLEREPFQEDYNSLYQLLLDKFVTLDNEQELRPFAQKILESRSRAASGQSSGSRDVDDCYDEDDVEADSLSESDEVEEPQVSSRLSLKLQKQQEKEERKMQKKQKQKQSSSKADNASNRRSKAGRSDINRPSLSSSDKNGSSSSKMSDSSYSKRFQLSEESKSLLEDFAELYCIPKHFIDLCHLEVLAKFGNSADGLEQILRILETYSPGRGRIFTKSEVDRFDSIALQVQTFIDSVIQHCTTSFDKKALADACPGSTALDACIKLVHFFHPIDTEMRLRSALKLAATRYYDSLKLSFQSLDAPSPGSDRSKNSNAFLRKMKFLLDIVDEMVDFVDDFARYYAPFFPSSTNILLTVVLAFVGLFTADLTTFFEEFDQQATTKDTADLLVLFQKVSYLIVSWATFVPGLENRIPIYSYTEKHILAWIHEMDANLYKWTVNSQLQDDNTPIGPEVLHSSSVVDLFSATSIAFDYLAPILKQWTQPTVYSFIDLFADSVSTTVILFCERIVRDIKIALAPYVPEPAFSSSSDEPQDRTLAESFQLLLQQKAAAFKLSPIGQLLNPKAKPGEPQPFNITSKICVKMNNIETCRVMFNDLATQVAELYAESNAPVPNNGVKLEQEDFAREKFGPTLKTLKDNLESILAQITASINTVLEPELFKILCVFRDPKGHIINQLVPRLLSPVTVVLKSNVEPTQLLERVFDYMNEQLGVISTDMYQSLFKRLLKQIWAQIIKTFYIAAVPSGRHFSRSHAAQSILKPAQIKLLLSLHEPLRSFLNADGNGIPDKQLQKDIDEQQAFLQWYALPSDELIQKYAACAAEASSTSTSKDYSLESMKSRAQLILSLLDIRGADKDRVAADFVSKQRAGSS